MNEAEFNARLAQLVSNAQSRAGVEGMDGIFDSIMGVVKSVVGKVGTGLKTVTTGLTAGVKSLGSGIVKIGSQVFTGLATVAKSPVAQAAVATGGAYLIQKKEAELRQAQTQLESQLIQQQQTQLINALNGAGVNVASPGATQLFADVASQGIVRSDGQYIYPPVAQQIQNAGGVQRIVRSAETGEPLAQNSNIMPIALAVSAAFALAVLVPKGGKK